MLDNLRHELANNSDYLFQTNGSISQYRSERIREFNKIKNGSRANTGESFFEALARCETGQAAIMDSGVSSGRQRSNSEPNICL